MREIVQLGDKPTMMEEEKQEEQLKGQFLVDEYQRMRRLGSFIILGALGFLLVVAIVMALLQN